MRLTILNSLILVSGSTREQITSLSKHFKTHYGQNTFLAKGVEYWNSLPPEITYSPNYPCFKKRVQNYALEKFEALPHDKIITGAWDGFAIHH